MSECTPSQPTLDPIIQEFVDEQLTTVDCLLDEGIYDRYELDLILQRLTVVILATNSPEARLRIAYIRERYNSR